ncbi:class I SAM-dependent methyltransferase [Anaeromusa sp.]|uniref:class I SAM-dependent methyltransferase n=1 Tax=Anaeromusa sp. TaxID=1872520 RepID=UPI002627035E|nr:class I SAM-dependent methyltransferase [Anaeromusa sp.]MDD3158022.1 class I SAM-dependent methyltransferase [Anaeromusa sp.]
MNIQEKIDRRWSRSAVGYSCIVCDELHSFRPAAWVSLIATQLGSESGREVLDIGTGPGFFSIILAQAGYRTTGIDCSAAMLEQAKRNAVAQNVAPTFALMDSHELTFPDNHFDLVLSRNVTWTQLQPVKAYQEWKRVLKPGGTLLVFDANWNRYRYDEGLMAQVLEREQKFRARYGAPYDTYEGPEEERELGIALPLDSQVRPWWDNGVLSALGFENIVNDLDITQQVWDEKERLLYGATPMFMIVAQKTKKEIMA